MQANPTQNPRRKARVVPDDPTGVIRRWLSAGWGDFRLNMQMSLMFGVGLMVLGWAIVAAPSLLELNWMILPTAAGAMLLGPPATDGLYRISRRAQGQGRGGIAAPGQITLVSVVMMTLARCGSGRPPCGLRSRCFPSRC